MLFFDYTNDKKNNAKYHQLDVNGINLPLVVNDPLKLLYVRYNVLNDGKAANDSRIPILILVSLKSRSCSLLKMFESIRQNKIYQNIDVGTI